MSKHINFNEFNKTPIIRKITKSKSIENLNTINEPKEESVAKKPRGRKSKYANDDERKEARRRQQREYRLRKRYELEYLRKHAENIKQDIDEPVDETINETPDDEAIIPE